MALDALLIEILVDPEDKEPLWYVEAEQVLYNPRLRRAYPIRDDIPIMLISEASSVDDARHEALAQAGHVLTGLGPSAPDAATGAGS